MYDISRFSLSDMTRCGIDLRKAGAGAQSMEDVAQRVCSYLREELGTGEGERACALARIFVTMPYSQLPPDLQEFARKLLPDVERRPETKCLTLLATVGDEREWNSRGTSAGHKALPLASEESIARSPMISQLMQQLGVDLPAILGGGDMMLDASHSFNVFHVPDAQGSPYIPAQHEFVKPHGIHTVLGFGGQLPPNELFATILFTRATIPRDAAELFKTLALNVKLALLPFAGSKVFS